MILQRLSLYHYKRPFEVSFKSSHAKRTCAESIIVDLEFDNGVSGLGESAPRQYVTGETIASVCNAIKNRYAPQLFQSRIDALSDIKRILKELEPGNPKPSKNILSAIGGIDLALLDALGHKIGCNVLQFLGTPQRNQAPLSLTIPLISPKDMKTKWQILRRWLPVQSVKVVLAGTPSDNCDRIAYIRDVIGPLMDMRIEVNGQWTYAEACKNLSKLCRFNLSGIEEPLVANDRDCLPQLKARFGIPIILDESICTFEDASNAIQNGSCDIINIKISKCGGLIRAQDIIHMAAMKNIACQIGTHVGESFILDSAGWHLALATPNLTYFEGCSFLLHNPSLSVDGTPPSRRKQPKNPGWGLVQRDIDELFTSSERLFELRA
jgi:L-Ala-D/L-Glu epimerase / N-acetyl-D-glutamate racemase